MTAIALLDIAIFESAAVDQLGVPPNQAQIVEGLQNPLSALG